MRVLVTGSHGFIGSNLIAKLLKDADDGIKSKLEIYTLDRVCASEQDIIDYDNLLKHILQFKPNVIVHLAADIEVGEAEAHPNKYYTDNLLGTINLLRCIVNSGNTIKLIFASTAAVYGNEVTCTNSYKEDDAGNPVSVYGRTKLMAEQIINDYAKVYNFPVVIFRFFNVAGGMDKHTIQCHLIPIVLERIKKGLDINIFGNDYDTVDGTCIRDYIHIADLCAAIQIAIYKEDVNGVNIYNLGSGKGYSVLQVVNKCLHVSCNQLNSKIFITERRAGDPAYLLADYSKINKEWAWQPEKDLHDIIIDTWKSLC